VIDKYVEIEDKYLETYNIMYGDYYDSENDAKHKLKEWDNPKSCPKDFEEVFKSVMKLFPTPSVCFPKRDTNPFYEVIVLMLEIQLNASKPSENTNRWTILIQKIYELNDISSFEPEDIIFLRFSVHFLILLHILNRVNSEESTESKSNRVIDSIYNEVIMKYLRLQEEVDSERVAFYLNFLHGDETKVDFYSDLIWSITDEDMQSRVLLNIDRHVPELKTGIIERIKEKLLEGERNPPRSGSNIEETVHKLKWLYYKENYSEFYRNVVEMARIFIRDQKHKVESLYTKLSDELDQ